VSEQAERLRRLDVELEEAATGWRLYPVVEAVQALRGLEFTGAVTLIAELGDLTRFDTPRKLMSYLGLTPSEYSSGAHRRQGGITKAGNGHWGMRRGELQWSRCRTCGGKGLVSLERKAGFEQEARERKARRPRTSAEADDVADVEALRRELRRLRADVQRLEEDKLELERRNAFLESELEDAR